MKAMLYARSNKLTQFTNTLTQNYIETESLTVNSTFRGGFIRSIGIIAKQNLAYGLTFYNNAVMQTSDYDSDSFAGMVKVTAGEGVQLSATGQYYYSKTGLSIPVYNAAASDLLYTALSNDSATSKENGTTGQMVVEIAIEPYGS